MDKTKVFTSGKCQKLMQKAAKWPCGVCVSGVGSNSIQCTTPTDLWKNSTVEI